jgi:hypothetical protein
MRLRTSAIIVQRPKEQWRGGRRGWYFHPIGGPEWLRDDLLQGSKRESQDDRHVANCAGYKVIGDGVLEQEGKAGRSRQDWGAAKKAH